MEELYPLSKKEFETLYDKAWENGWVYGRFFQELYDEYLVNWVYFVDYLDVLKGASKKSRMYARVHDKFVIVIAKNQQPILIEAEDHFKDHFATTTDKTKPLEGIEILIGEAPPYWKGNAKNEDKSYFYNPNYYVKKGSWITAPLAFKKIAPLQSKAEDKTQKLCELAKKGMFLFDVFPFPIIQDTKIRQAVSGKFPEHIAEYFIPKLKSIIKYISLKKERITYGFVATTYGSLHLLFGDKTRKIFKGFDRDFYTKGIVVGVSTIELVYQGKIKKQIVAFNGEILTARFKTIYKLICPEAYFESSFNKIIGEDSFKNNKYVKEINGILKNNKIPILMDGSGNVNFNTFFNGSKPSREKFETEEKNI
jgi:hypothetical protein